jgi:chromosome segregation ATPase
MAYLRNDLSAKEKRCAEIARELARCQTENAGAANALAQSEQKRIETRRALELTVEQRHERLLEAAQAAASIQALSHSRDEQERKVESIKDQIQESRSRLHSLEDLHRNYEGYQEGVRAIMLKRQKEASPNGVYGLVADVIEAPEPYEKALTAVLGDRLQYVIVKGQEEGVEAIEYLKRQATGRGSFIPLQLSRKQVKPLPLGEAEVLGPLMEMITVKDGYGDVAEYLLSDVVVVKDMTAGLALWNRNGFYCTLVTLDGEVIDSMGVVTGGSGAALDGSIFTQRRRIRELGVIVHELEDQLCAEDQVLIRFKEELDEAETKKTLLAARCTGWNWSACVSNTNVVQPIKNVNDHQPCRPSVSNNRSYEDLGILDDEIRRCRESAEARNRKSERSSSRRNKRCAALRMARKPRSAVTQSRIRMPRYPKNERIPT